MYTTYMLVLKNSTSAKGHYSRNTKAPDFGGKKGTIRIFVCAVLTKCMEFGIVKVT